MSSGDGRHKCDEPGTNQCLIPSARGGIRSRRTISDRSSTIVLPTPSCCVACTASGNGWTPVKCLYRARLTRPIRQANLPWSGQILRRYLNYVVTWPLGMVPLYVDVSPNFSCRDSSHCLSWRRLTYERRTRDADP